MKDMFNWQFLDEPIYRWFLFLIVIAMFSATWQYILGHIKAEL